MIRFNRTRRAEPAALNKIYDSGDYKGKTEFERVKALLDEHQARGEDRSTFSFKYERYREEEVKKALSKLFHGKCAYCESNYGGTQPMDVEHWRPKGAVHLDNGKTSKPGYYWLAATWTNLLPSCIDCNRSRAQYDIVEGKPVTIGKANQFPVENERQRPRSHEKDRENNGGAERPLLISPCPLPRPAEPQEDPEDFFVYGEDGVIRPAAENGPERQRALVSIRVYALNRSGLVAERQGLLALIDHRFELIAKLEELRSRLLNKRPPEPDLAGLVEQLIGFEGAALEAMCEESQPYAGMARQFIGEALELAKSLDPAP